MSENGTNIFLANIIWLFHFILVLFVILAPVSKMPSILIIHITFCMSLIIHWINNNDVCSLSVLESKLRGLDYTQSFTHKFIGPVYNISKKSWTKILYVIVVILMFASSYLLYKSNCFRKFISGIDKYRNSTLPKTEKNKLLKESINYLYKSD